MNPIQMVDLKSQYQHIKPEVDKGIQEVLDSCAFINGPAVKRFQENLEKYLSVKHVIPCANGTDALQVAMMALNLKPGDEVITTTFTFVATAEVIGLLGLTPVLVDVDPHFFNIDIDAIEKAITPKTKAIVPVHLFGQSADMEAIMRLAKKHNLFVIEDTCQAIGADFIYSDGRKQKVGTIGDVGCVSFFPSKNLGCYGDGGALFTNDDTLAEKLRIVVNHGMKVRYYHDEIGVNSRLDSIQAVVLDAKLKHLDTYNQNRENAATYYSSAFSKSDKLTVPALAKNSTHVFHQYTLQLHESINRDDLIKHLADKGIPAMIYYPVPLHQQKAYLDPRYKDGDFPVSEKLAKTVISLPMHSELSEEQLKYIVSAVLEKISG
ncbi:MAG: DegT/DnrJ/EryC1/StrS family aminotransferase [Bacteroidales bacterium]|jgi:dTDP-4-amino-4,6-dideoxygalactose transaminase|nr:DegT/DnrJ/EryC1/StrS family aminotransferase [Bacteroidales bacterium]